MSERKRAQVLRWINVAFGVAVLIALVIIIWVDVTSQVWQETVILSGVAAGLVTFLLTALFLERAMARREHQKWAPVTRLALSDLLHTIADGEGSDLKRAQVVARSLPETVAISHESLQDLLHAVVVERDDITKVLARWAQFLANSADVQDLMVHIASIAQSLDEIRDQVVEIEQRDQSGPAVDALRAKLSGYNALTQGTINEILEIQNRLAVREA